MRKPLQVYMDEKDLKSLKDVAQRQGCSVSDVVRESVERYLINLPVDNDPALSIVGKGRSRRGDLAVRHDDYVIRESKEPGS